VGSEIDIGAYERSPAVTPLTVTISQAAGQADPTPNSTINFTVVFSDVVNDFATGDVAIRGTAGAITAVVSDAGDHRHLNVADTLVRAGTQVASATPTPRSLTRLSPLDETGC
jgi:hypothetical protein